MTDLLLIRSNDQKNVYGDTNEFTACELPFWCAQIAAYVRLDPKISVGILDAEAHNLSVEETVKRVQEFCPSLIGLIVTGTHLSASTQKMHGAGILAREIKAHMPSTKIFMWGLHPSALPKRTLLEEAVDFVIRGENLDSIARLTKSIKNSEQNFDNIPGLFYLLPSGEVKGNFEIILQENLDSLPLVAYDLLPMKKYRAHNWQRMGKLINNGVGGGDYSVIATSIGCPFSCSFCAISALFQQKKIRYRSADSVANEIGYLVENYGTHYIKILDECFVLNKEHVSAICDKLIEHNYDINIWAYARIDTVDKNILDKLAKAKVKWLAYGIESASDRSLKDVKKGQYNADKVKKVIEMTHQAGINVIANYMFGLPEDDYDSMQKTLSLARDLNCEWINLYCTMAYPGSKLYFDCVSNGVPLPESWLGYSQYSYECCPLPTKYLTGKEVLRFRDAAFQDYFKDNEKYFSMIRKKFGDNAVQNITAMLNKRLKRKILDD